MQAEQLLCWSSMTDTEHIVQHLDQTKKNVTRFFVLGTSLSKFLTTPVQKQLATPLQLDLVHLPEKHLPERRFSRKTRMSIYPNVHFTEWTLARIDTCLKTLARMYYIFPNGH